MVQTILELIASQACFIVTPLYCFRSYRPVQSIDQSQVSGNFEDQSQVSGNFEEGVGGRKSLTRTEPNLNLYPNYT